MGRCLRGQSRRPLVWATPGERKEEVVRPFLHRRKRAERFGLYYVMMSQERGPSFRIAPPKFPTADPDHMILRAQRSRYRHYYFYIYDEVLGAMLLRVGSFVPFAVTAYINGHEFIARSMQKQGIGYTQPDNCFTAVGDREALQAAADAFSAQVIQERIDYWSFHLGPKFSKKERVACGGLRRFWSLQQIEYCHNFVFKRNHPIRRLFERACELSLYLLSADRIGQIFAQPVRRRVRANSRACSSAWKEACMFTAPTGSTPF